MLLSPDQKLRLSSRPENILLVERLIEDVCDVFSVGEEKYGNILISVTEAVNNAIYHGNKSNPGKNFDVTFKTDPKNITFIIKDEGPGFDYNNLPDPTAPENIEKDHGRGIFLMKSLADKVEFEDEGRSVVLSFAVSSST